MPLRRPCIDCGTPTTATRCDRCATGAHRVPRPCIDCGTPTTSGDHCPRHQPEITRNARRIHYHGDYPARAAKIRAEARICWLCGYGARPDDPWTADHVIPGDPDSPLRPAHRSCNSARGNRT